MIVIVSHTKKDQTKFNWLRFSSRFVNGGLPVGNQIPKILNAHLYRGFNARTAQDEPKHRQGPRQWTNKFSYRWARPVRNLVQLTAPPTLLSYLDIEAAAASLEYQKNWYHHFKFERLANLAGWLFPFGGVARWIHIITPWWYKPEQNVSFSDALSDAPVAGLRKSSTRLVLYRSRWYNARNKSVQFDLLRSLFHWRSNFSSTFPAFRYVLLNVGSSPREENYLHIRLRFLERKHRSAVQLSKRALRYEKHVQYLFTRLTQKVSKTRLRQIRFHRKKLQRVLSQRPDSKKWFNLVTRSFFRRFKTNRGLWLEELKLTNPFADYVEGLYYRATRMFNVRVGNVLEYTYFKKFSTYFTFINRKTVRSKRWRLGDHPVQAKPFVEARNQRWGWFQQGELNSITQSALEDKRQKKKLDLPLLDPLVPPVEIGFWSITYWNLQEWGRGSRWRTKPVNRALHVFLQSVRSGHSREYDMQQWSHAATSATGVKHSLLAEVELDIPESATPQVVLPQTFDLDNDYNVVVPVLPSLWTRSIKPTLLNCWLVTCEVLVPLLYFLYSLLLMVLYPCRWIYQIICFVCVVVSWVIRELYSEVDRLFVTFQIGYKIFSDWYEGLVVKFWRDSPFVKTCRWVYISWLITYSSGDDATELEIPALQEDERDNFFAEEEEMTGNYGEDNDDLGGHPLKDPPRFPWEGWWEKETSSFYIEGLEIAQEIFLEEIPTYARLITRPFIDFFIRFPLWGFLDGATLMLAAIKLDTQTLWYNILTKGNTVDPATRVTTRVAGRWWKWPLIAFRFVTHWVLTVTLMGVLSHQLDYSVLKLWVSYSLGLTFHDEYYLLWLCFCVGASIWLIGPASWKSYFFHEIGLSNLLFLLVGSSSLTFPEEYYPHRGRNFFLNEWVSRSFRFVWKDGYFDATASDRIKPGVYGLTHTDDFRLTLAQTHGYNDFYWEWEIDDVPFNTGFAIPHLDDFTLYRRHFPTNALRLDLNLEKRHPSFARSNFYDIHFVVNDAPSKYVWPAQHYTGPVRNRQILYTRNQSEIASNIPPE